MNWLEPITEFNSISEYNQFILYLSKRLSENEIEEIEPKEYFHGKSPYGLNKDRWFRDCSCQDIWRLVPPDFPFKGFFEKVEYPLKGYKSSG
jgi:hypothetical protein